MTGLARGHRDQPADQRRHDRIEEQHHIGEQEAQRADEVQALVDPAVMVEAMVIPTLGTQLLQEILDHWFPQHLSEQDLQGFDVSRVTSS
ncbi:hypothetical protein ACVJF2_005398 [Bradyrhizobium sp. USDA 4519]